MGTRVAASQNQLVAAGYQANESIVVRLQIPIEADARLEVILVTPWNCVRRRSVDHCRRQPTVLLKSTRS